ncbi:hypothetical protein ACGFX4_08075 [Kitasatospora sp. NPDC048365]|uniref:hypothetical protein n=1 Tax=Kitasatospora sp. NPDC048365 TaxID=3364050 RepID=UPI003710871E
MARNQDNTDQAALGSATVAAVLAVSTGDGRYNWFSLAVGLALAFLVASYYRPGSFGAGRQRERVLRSLAFGACMGLTAAMIAAWPVQAVIGTPAGCRGAEDVDNCAGAAAGDWVGVCWAVGAVLLTAVHWWISGERAAVRVAPAPDASPTASPTAPDAPPTEPLPAPGAAPDGVPAAVTAPDPSS